MSIDLNVNPYYSDDERAQTSNYKQILFVPARAVQGRELTQLQSLIYQQIQKNMDTIYKNGTPITGLDLAITKNGSVTTAHISKGKFYFEGRVLDVDELSLVISGSSDEVLGVFVKNEFINAS